ncbi:M23 family metallopeptidase [Treponema sp.]
MSFSKREINLSFVARAALILAFSSSMLMPIVHFIANPLGAQSLVTGEEALIGMGDIENAAINPNEKALSMDQGIPEPASFSAPEPLYYASYKIQKGDTIGEIARDFGLAQDTILSFNDIKNSRLLQIGKYLKIPNQDGLLHLIKRGDTIKSLSEKYSIDEHAIEVINGTRAKQLAAGDRIFLPSARLERTDLQEINGDLFIWPVRGAISSNYGYRTSPFTGARQFHSGLDIAAAYGTSIKAAMAGRVSATGFDINSGNYVVITHHSGYRTFYGHMSVIRANVGEYVKTGERIGDVGSTGLSTGSHVHFTVFKNGVTVNPRVLIN